MRWLGPASMILSAVLVVLTMMVSSIPVGSIALYPFLGVMLAVCAWFAYWGALGAVIGYAVPILVGVPLLPALQSIVLNVLTVAVFVGLVRVRWVDTAARKMASLIGLAHVILITFLIRQLLVFGIFTVPALFRYPAVGLLLWNFLLSSLELGVTTFIVTLLLLRFGTPMIKRLHRRVLC